MLVPSLGPGDDAILPGFDYFCSMFTKRIADYIAAGRLLAADVPVIVALSGGADSVALLCVLRELGYALHAVHCNFHLRGAESDRDETFVRGLCERLHVPLSVEHFQTEAYAREHKLSIEMAARELRYEAFERIRRECGAGEIAVAHHRDDSVETLLLNLIRGTGINGLKGIRPRNGHVVRPLLAVSRQEIERYLQERGQDYVTDSTNLHDDFTRNKIRLHLLPLMEQLNPSVREGLAATAERLADVAALYNKVMAEEQQRVAERLPDGGIRIRQADLCTSEAPKSLLYELLSPYGFRPAQLEAIYASAASVPGRRFRSLTHEVVVDRDCWLLYPLTEGEWGCLEIASAEGSVPLPDGMGRVSWSVMPGGADVDIPRGREFACLDADKLTFPLTLRRVARGDWFIPFGMKGKKLLSDYMTDRKFPLNRKERQWLLWDGDRVAWVVGERIDNRFRVDEHTRKILRLHYKGV